MKKACKQARDHFPELLLANDKQLPEQQKPQNHSELDNYRHHLTQCADCAQSFASFSQTFGLFSYRQEVEPEPQLFDRVWRKAALEVSQVTERESGRFGWFRLGTFGPFLAAAALLVIGFWMGRRFPQTELVAPTLEVVNANDTSHPLDQKVLGYLQKTKTIILAIDNFDTDHHELARFDFRSEKRVSQALLLQSEELKQELEDKGSARLLELVTDLELILLQIAHLQNRVTPFDLEMVQDGINRRAILFKINIEEMKRSLEEQPPKQERGRRI